MDKPRVTPKDFFLWIGAVVSLYGAIVAFVALIFEYINHAFPNPVNYGYYYDSSYSSISYQSASLIVLTPVTLILMRVIRRNIAQDPTRKDIWVRRWALFLTLFIAGTTFVVDLIVLLNAYLQGEDLTIGFLLKVLTVLLVAALGFMHFMADVRGYWEEQPGRAKAVNYGVGLLLLVAIGAGFFIVGTPQQIRAEKQDMIRVNDLESIQWLLVNYWQQKESLPAALADLNDPIRNSVIPLDPKTQQPYEYRATGALSFELCATFAGEREDRLEGERPMMDPTSIAPGGKTLPDNWAHAAGRACFQRTIDPELYPPYSKAIR